MLVRDILDAPQLRMRLLHGDTAELKRPVARVCATDMPDPRPFVTAGALVCTGLVWRQHAEDSDRYVGMLAEAGIAGVVAGQALHGHVPEDVVAACERHGLPLLSAPQSVPFSRIIEYLADQAAELRWRRVQSRVDRQRRLLAAVADGSSVGDLIAEIALEQEISAWLVSSTGRVIAGTAPISEDELDRIVATALTAPRLPAVTRGAVRVLQVGASDRITAWYLAIRPAAAEPEAFGPDLAAIAELYRQRGMDRLHLDWELIDRFPAAPADRPGARAVAVVCAIQATETRTDIGLSEVRVALHDALSGATTSIDKQGRLVAIVDGTQDQTAEVLRRRLGRIAPALTGPRPTGPGTESSAVRLAFGVSAQQRDESLSGAIAAAAAAATAALDDDAPVSVRIADIDTAVGLFTAVPGGLQRRFAERVLGPVVDYDRKNGAGLLETLEVYLGCDGSWRQAADRMHLHLNTVRYRIGRVEELTGRDLGRIDDRLDLYLAVRTLTAPAASA
ncbi:PucR family transcriptional regulator [Nocardia sp. NBC_01503]|uniref:PucR family transcriptional regulator n=1 Tax=Nocardia sp. NBC_01503 TaxID=2975997 RepID=UPI002E7C0365|nr:PucR family transcriptional regulator [Nocardia sp. NBC_01503]WTL33058.1 PucR family transcriptional regulator [Nocardia sp. NBC_01503]